MEINVTTEGKDLESNKGGEAGASDREKSAAPILFTRRAAASRIPIGRARGVAEKTSRGRAYDIGRPGTQR